MPHKWNTMRYNVYLSRTSTVSAFMTHHHRVCNYINTTGATSGVKTVYPSGAIEFISVFSGARVTRSLVLCVCLVDRCLSFCSFSFGHCVVCPSSIYEFWLPLWYLQTLPVSKSNISMILLLNIQVL